MNRSEMRILGIDPGLRTTGFGVIHKAGQQALLYSIRHHQDADASLPERLKAILDSVAEVSATYRPDCAAIEKVFVNVNPQSTLLLGQARGAAICALVSADLAVAEYTALQVKQAVVGHGKAKKEQVQDMVQRLLLLPGLPGTGRGRRAGRGDLPCAQRRSVGDAGQTGAGSGQARLAGQGRTAGRLAFSRAEVIFRLARSDFKWLFQ